MLPHRLHFPWKNASACSLLGEGLAWHGFFGLAFSQSLAWFLCHGQRFVVAILLLASRSPVPACALFPDELPTYALALAARVLSEAGGAAPSDKDHCHDLLLGDFVQLAIVCQVGDLVGVLNHRFPPLLRELE